MNPDEEAGELETAIATDDAQITAEADAPEASEPEQAEAPDDETEDLGEGSEPVYSVLIDGEERQLSKSEIEKSMMLHKAFTQKSQALAEKSRQWEAQQNRDIETLSARANQIKQGLEFYQSTQPQEPNWASMAREKGPSAAYQAQLEWNEKKGEFEQAKQVYQQIRQQEDNLANDKFLAEMGNEFPDWAADDDHAEKELAEIWVTAGAYGFTRDDIVAARNPKVFKVLKDAAEWRKLQAKKTEVQARVTDMPKKPPVRTVAKPSGLDEKIATAIKAAKGGNLEAAAEVMRLRHMKAK